MSRDLLEMLRTRTITYEEAMDIFDEAVRRFHDGQIHTPWPSELGLSEYEATAYLQGATLKDLVKLRYQGWPTTCCRCNEPIEYRNYGWWVSHNELGDLCLQHIRCPNEDIRDDPEGDIAT